MFGVEMMKVPVVGREVGLLNVTVEQLLKRMCFCVLTDLNVIGTCFGG